MSVIAGINAKRLVDILFGTFDLAKHEFIS
jgi:hypothetical protein